MKLNLMCSLLCNTETAHVSFFDQSYLDSFLVERTLKVANATSNRWNTFKIIYNKRLDIDALLELDSAYFQLSRLMFFLLAATDIRPKSPICWAVC